MGGRVKIVVAVPTTFRGVSPYFIDAYANTVLTLANEHKVITRILISGEPIDKARSFLADFAVKQGADYILFLDDDVFFDPAILKEVIKLRLPFVSGIYETRKGKPNIMRKVGDKYIDVDKVPESVGLVQVDAVGLGCALIHTSVLKRVKEFAGDYFRFTHDIITDEGYGEDVWFCDQLRKLKIPVFVYTKWRCGHYIAKLVM
jgi:hypothetical protein